MPLVCCFLQSHAYIKQFVPLAHVSRIVKYIGLLNSSDMKLQIQDVLIYMGWECPRGVMVKAMDCEIVGSEFVLQSRYYVHFRANTFGKGMNLLILPAMG